MNARVDFQWLPPQALVLPSPAAARFVGPREFVDLALAVFYAASRDQEPPQGEPWASDEYGAWSGPEDFFAGLLHHFESRLRAAALATGFAIERPWSAEEVAEHEAFLEAMAHGCAAPSPAVGPAPEASNGAEHNLPDNPLFRACDPQGLQVVNIRVDNRPIMGGSTHE